MQLANHDCIVHEGCIYNIMLVSLSRRRAGRPYWFEIGRSLEGKSSKDDKIIDHPERHADGRVTKTHPELAALAASGSDRNRGIESSDTDPQLYVHILEKRTNLGDAAHL